MSDLLLALDQGTTGTSASFFDASSFELIASCKEEFPQIYPRSGHVEHDPNAIWKSLQIALRRSWEQAQSVRSSLTLRNIAAIGITNQRETVVAWNRRSGELAGNAIVWQDRRTSDFCSALKKDEVTRKKILNLTGLVCDPYFSASKMRWMLEHYPKAAEFERKGELVFGTVDSYLIFLLSGGTSVVTEHTNASRTMVYGLAEGKYHSELMALFGVSEAMLPEILPSVGHFAKTKGLSFLPDGIPITGCLGDQQSALFGHAATTSGKGKITYGTGAFLLVATGSDVKISDRGILTTVALATARERSFALEGSAFIAGAAVQFIRDNFGWIKNASEAEALALSSERDPSLLFVPALAGLGAPYWNPNAKGALLGLSRGSSKSQIMRAVLESIALQNVLILQLMQECSGTMLQSLGVDGGAAKSDYLMQFQSDIGPVELLRSSHTEITALGAARAALQGLDPQRALPRPTITRSFAPKMNSSEARSIVNNWRSAVELIDSYYRESSNSTSSGR